MHRLAIVSNRLPVALTRDDDTRFSAAHSPGGLVSALEPVLHRKGGLWIGWPGVASEDCDGEAVAAVLAEVENGIRMVPVSLNRDEIARYYGEFANSSLWPAFHGLLERCRVDDAACWQAYRRINQRFAHRLVAELDDDVVAWVHDYQLLLVGEEVRRLRPAASLGFFLHTPFPRADELAALPWSREILSALLAYDLVGFQTRRDLGHFAEAVSRLLGLQARPLAEGRIRVAVAARPVIAGHFPIGIDAAAWTRRATSVEVEERMTVLRREIGPQAIALGVDRLDYTKGLLERLAAWERMLEQHPEAHGQVTLVQVVVPSREAVAGYADLRAELERQVGRVCGRFATPGWVPVRHLYRSLPAAELAALYRMADAALVTPLCDGMNLVAKEYCAAQVDRFGALVLGRAAGAAEQLGAAGAILVTPREVDATADAIHRALTMDLGERRRRMEAMRHAVAQADVFRWADGFLTELDEVHSRRGRAAWHKERKHHAEPEAAIRA